MTLEPGVSIGLEIALYGVNTRIKKGELSFPPYQTTTMLN